MGKKKGSGEWAVGSGGKGRGSRVGVEAHGRPEEPATRGTGTKAHGRPEEPVARGSGGKAHGPAEEPLTRGTGAKAHGRPEEPEARGTDDFEFKVDGKRAQIRDAEMVASLKAFARRVGGRPFEMSEFNMWPRRRCRANTITKRFGSWRRALEAAGVEGAHSSNYTTEDLMKNLELVWRKVGRAPGGGMLRRYGTMRPGAYRRRWGTIKRACELLAAHKRGELSRADLLRGGIQEYRRALSPRVRWEVIERGGRRCAACGARGEGVVLEVDHVVPVSAGGGDEVGNLRVLCFACNRGKGGKGVKGGKH